MRDGARLGAHVAEAHMCRREAILAGVAAVASIGLGSGLVAAVPGQQARWRIDVHHHFGSPAYDAFTAAHPEAGLPPAPAGSIAHSLEEMDRAGIAMTILSSFVPPSGGSVEDRRALARNINEHGARVARDNPSRFALFAVLPLPDIEGCLQELSYGLDTLGAVGATVYTEALGKYLGDPTFAPLMEALDKRRAVLFVHPKTDSCCRNLVSGVPDSLIEFGTSTSRTIASLLFNGTVDRYPNIRFVFSHGGGTVPFLIERFLGTTKAEIVPGTVTEGQPRYLSLKQPNGGALQALRRFHYDTAQIANPVALQTLARVVSPRQILFGTDSWFRSPVQTAAAFEKSGVFSASERRAIGRDNALRLFPDLALKRPSG